MKQSEKKGENQWKLAIFIIANSIVWGAVIIATSIVLKGTNYMDKLIPILGGAAVFSVVLLPGGLLTKKQKKTEDSVH